MKIWQYNTLPIDSLRQKCIDKLVSLKPQVIDYELLDSLDPYDIEPSVDIRRQSDELRYKILAKNADAVWFDTDVWIEKWWTPPDNGKIYCDLRHYKKPSQLFDSVIYVNGQCDVFKQMVDELLAIEPAKRPLGWIHTFFTKHPDLLVKVAPIPKGYFFHLLFSFYLPLTKNNYSVGNTSYSITKNSQESFDIHIAKNQIAK